MKTNQECPQCGHYLFKTQQQHLKGRDEFSYCMNCEYTTLAPQPEKSKPADPDQQCWQ